MSVIAEAVKETIRENLKEKKRAALCDRGEATLCALYADNEGLRYLYEMKVNQIVGYIDALDDLLEELE